ncbi:hypothetical protein T265_06470 [Opisthorchis viverrini]|uniref:Uncharacterized protein n=1 Tax=Opisthorchis viverrini TaxID=6198 RepID=A0A074ZG70_OPIVI|nr:hypothetical protein T265_06470 [Opisthorchis viverrini]KER26276.1 hypothetical protein T265_06470 [Opisthorchis viverrini]
MGVATSMTRTFCGLPSIRLDAQCIFLQTPCGRNKNFNVKMLHFFAYMRRLKTPLICRHFFAICFNRCHLKIIGAHSALNFVCYGFGIIEAPTLFCVKNGCTTNAAGALQDQQKAVESEEAMTAGVQRIACHITPTVVTVNPAHCVVVLFRLVPWVSPHENKSLWVRSSGPIQKTQRRACYPVRKEGAL